MAGTIRDDGFDWPKGVTIPDEAREKIDALRDMERDRRAIAGVAKDRWREVYQDFRSHEREVERLKREMHETAGRGAGFRSQDADGRTIITHENPNDRVGAAEQAMRKLQKKSGLLEVGAEEREARAREVGQVVQAVQAWLIDLPEGTVLVSVAPEKTHKPTAKRRDLITELRAEIYAQHEWRERVEAAPSTSSSMKAKVRAAIETMAMRGRPNIEALLDGTGGIVWPMLTERRMTANNYQFEAETGPDALALLAWLDGERMIEAIERDIDARADDENALSDEERAAQLVEIAANILEIERQEEALIVREEAEGRDVPRRPEASVLAILGVEIAGASAQGVGR